MRIQYLPLAVFALLCLAGQGVASAQSADELFAAGAVHELRLFVHSRDLSSLREDYRGNTFYPADLHWQDQRVRNIGVRSRGNGSRSGTKPGLQLDFGYYVTGQRFAGLTSVALDNLVQDPSMIRERVAMAFFARMGQPASRISFTRLYINNEYAGLYALVEDIDPAYLLRTVGENSGYLFEYHWLRAYYFEDLGNDLGSYAPLFEPRTHARSSVSTLYAPIREMVRAGDGTDLVAWRERIESYVDLRQLISLVAVSEFLSEYDGLAGYEGANNFYLYRPAGSNRHIFLPWDRDHAFHGADTSPYERVGANHLLRQALAFADLRALYDEILLASARSAAADHWLEQTIARDANLVAQHASEDRRKPYTNDEHAEAISFLLDFATRRPGIVTSQVEQAAAEMAAAAGVR